MRRLVVLRLPAGDVHFIRRRVVCVLCASFLGGRLSRKVNSNAMRSVRLETCFQR